MKKIIAITIFITACLGLVGCGTKTVANDVDNITIAPIVEPEIEIIEQVNLTKKEKDEKEYYDSVSKEFEIKYQLRNRINPIYISSVNSFASRLGTLLLQGETDNAMISPVSIQMALSLLASGAKGETQDEILSVLEVGEKGETYLSEQSSILLQLLTTNNVISKLHIANSLWLHKGVIFEKSFLTKAESDYHASLNSVDFQDHNTAKKMSEWIKENTNSLINPQIQVSKDQIMSILNTIYFKDEWNTCFLEKETKKDTFTLESGDTIECDYMNSTYELHQYFEGEGFTTSYLSTKCRSNMYFVLPDEGVSVNELLNKKDLFDKILNVSAYESGKVIFQLPKFNFGSKHSLKSVLGQMGIDAAFREEANFTGITKSTAFVSEIIHQSHVAIDEKGVEAAAYTHMVLCGSAMPKEQKVIQLKLNRPFLFVIENEGVILFIGVVNNPLLT